MVVIITPKEVGMEATLVTGWEALYQELGATFSKPTFVTFLKIATG